MPLTDVRIRTAKPAEKPYKLSDERGLFLFVSPSGGKWWRMKYRFGGKEKQLSLGVYPDVSLKDARDRRDEARKLLANGIDPGEVKKAQKAAIFAASTNSFEAVAREWHATWKVGKSEEHAKKVIARLERDVFPWIGKKPVSEISPPVVLNNVLRRIEQRGYSETTFRAKGAISQVMCYAIATGRAERDPCQDLRGVLASPERGNYAAVTTPAEARKLLLAMDAFKGTYTVRAALLLAPLLFARIGELRTAKWTEIDLERAEWRYTVSKTKTEHLVPLAKQAVEILRDLHQLTGHGVYVFPGARDHEKPMSGGAINVALRRIGYDTGKEMTGHGFRAMARTLLAEELHFPREVIEHQLAHAVADTLGTAYNRTKFLKERRVMMQQWADYLDRLKKGADIVELRPTKMG
ncbi:MAG: integrase arm-type DNA-binding domain-containing protein [Betaproteobacteria bacterium]|nr:integrase arm-type DNA-binding domain-containing protein [Betaproteobacteria bacterium]